jgi:hypothetical protein
MDSPAERVIIFRWSGRLSLTPHDPIHNLSPTSVDFAQAI